MNTLRAGIGVVVLACFGAVAYTVVPAQSDPPPPPIAVEVLTPRAAFTDEVAMQIRNKVGGTGTEVRNLHPAGRIVTARLTIQPGAQFPWHTHPGPVMVTVAAGELTYVEGDDCSQRLYSAGSAFIDIGDHVHTAYNSGTTVTTTYVTWLAAPAEGLLTVPAPPPACA